jgi:predicted dehydrogenase
MNKTEEKHGIRVGLSGFGSSAECFHLPLLQSDERFSLVAAFDPVPQRRSFAEEAGFERVFDSSELTAEAIRDLALDCLVVTSPTSFHYPQAEVALEAGVHVLVDKPITRSVAELDQLISGAEKYGLAVIPFQNRRYDDDHQKILNIINSGDIGSIIRIDASITNWGQFNQYAAPEFDPQWRCQLRYGGGCLNDWGPHLLDQILQITDRKMPSRIQASSRSSLWSLDCDDLSMAIYDWDSFSVRLLISAVDLAPLERFRVCGTQGTIIVRGDDTEGEIEICKSSGAHKIHYENKPEAAFPFYELLVNAVTDSPASAHQKLVTEVRQIIVLINETRERMSLNVDTSENIESCRKEVFYGGRKDSKWQVNEITGDELWDDFVRSSSDGNLFQTTAWQKASPFRFRKLGIFRHQKLIAGIVVQINKSGHGETGSLAPYLGPISNTTAFSALSKEEQLTAENRLAMILKESVPNAEFFVSPWLQNLQPYLSVGFNAQLLYTKVVPTVDLQNTWNAFSPVLRRNIRRAEKDGLTAIRTTDFVGLLELVQKTFDRQNLPIWFEAKEALNCMNRLAQLNQAVCFITYDRENNPVAGAGIVWDWQRSYYILGGYDSARKHRGASSLALWNAIQFTHYELHLPELDLEGSNIPAIEIFFRQFGGKQLPFYYVMSSPNPIFAEEIL